MNTGTLVLCSFSSDLCGLDSTPSCSIITTSSFARFAHSTTSPSFAYVSNLAPDTRLSAQSSVLLPDCRIDCCSPFASASAAAPRPLARLHPLQLLLTAIASASAAAPRLHPLRLYTAPRLQPQLFQPMPECSLKFSAEFEVRNYEGRVSLV